MLTKFLFWDKTGHQAMISCSFKQLVRQLVYTDLMINNYVTFHLWWNENLEKVSKYYDHHNSKVFLSWVLGYQSGYILIKNMFKVP